MNPAPVSSFLRQHYRHFNAATLIDAADAYRRHLDGGGKMLLAMAGAMSTAELGLSLAQMIRADKVHAICCTGANLEEDVFNLVAHEEYVRVPNYPDLSPADEVSLLERKLNRVTDTCIPETVMRKVERVITEAWLRAEGRGERLFPHEYFYRILREEKLKTAYQIDVRDSWLACGDGNGSADVRSRLGGLDHWQPLRRPMS
jgi:deoxyhypusine synthase